LTKPKNANDTRIFVGYFARDAEGTQLLHASLTEKVLSIFEQDPLIVLILTGVEILKNSINSKYRGLSDVGGQTRISKLFYKCIEIKYS
jgi:hypothetical protein